MWDHPCVAIFLATMLVWGFFLPWIFTFSFCINPWDMIIYLRDALRDFLPFVQVKNPEKHSWRSLTFSKVSDKLY